MKHFCSLNISIGRTKKVALIDTGASCSCISSNLVAELQLNLKHKSKRVTIKTFSRSKKSYSKWVNVPVQIQNTIHSFKFYVIDNLTPNIIIGRTHCEKLEMEIKFSTGEILIQGELVKT